MAEFGFMAGIYTAGGEGPPVYVAKAEITVDAEDQDAAEEIAAGRLEEMLADGFIVEDELIPI